MNVQKDINMRPSIKPPAENRNWFKRTFSSLGQGGLRGNIFLLIMTTSGSAITLLPYYAKINGLGTMLMIFFFSAGVSYISSYLLYIGFQATNSETYDTCIKEVMGSKMGLLANVMVFLHTLGSTIAVQIFSAGFLLSSIVDIVSMIQQIDEHAHELLAFYFNIFYFILMFVLVFLVSALGSVDKLKKLSILGFLIMIYVTFVVVYETPSFYLFNNEKIEPSPQLFKFNYNFFEAFGLGCFLFLNQYTIIPICNNLNYLNTTRISSVIGRTLLFCGFLYTLFMICGYFSLPDDLDYVPKIFLNRSTIDSISIYPMLIGKLLFSFNLIIGLLIKSHFLLLYYFQLVNNVTSYQSIPESNQILDPEIEEVENQEQIEIQENNQKNNITQSFIFLMIITGLSYTLMNYLLKFVSIVGSFVGIFEIVVFPFVMFYVINKKVNVIGKFQMYFLFLVGAIFVILATLSIIIPFIIQILIMGNYIKNEFEQFQGNINQYSVISRIKNEFLDLYLIENKQDQQLYTKIEISYSNQKQTEKLKNALMQIQLNDSFV